MREGWICARCKASVSTDERTCPGCTPIPTCLTPYFPRPSDWLTPYAIGTAATVADPTPGWWSGAGFHIGPS